MGEMETNSHRAPNRPQTKETDTQTNAGMAVLNSRAFRLAAYLHPTWSTPLNGRGET